MGKVLKIILMVLVLLLILLITVFTGRPIVFLLTIVFAVYFYNKESKKEKKEAARIEESISENGIVNHHAKEIIQNYGHGTFVNKQPKEIEVTVNEYIDLFGIDTTEFTVFDIANEINKEVNEKIE
ncbi:hypothetical protein [Methanimicrococcus blatticola]|uniref:Uncharacterized protein n=1 Tax=Methanimicrococcus blatticola TaxID=91560 RepID=A0A484F835_9EURY|nr:hypothetical protein [Methanimicrococcus blatticola]MBZ3935225.1 hypothetical protein [Methanimicrococcus blatticola]MCC2508678.1 hypothetical protein [Methanimicrococcus blatticola]TDQ71285.1 hypothetical protein C7391_0393 [Methanimicrococcus blatticola]